MRSHTAVPDTTVLADAAEIPGLGHLPVNAFVLHAEQPVLVDSGLPASAEEFQALLWEAVDPAELRWIYLTHPDRDHTGSLLAILAAAPQARLVTTFTGLGILGIDSPIPPDRVYLLNPGQALDVGDRRLRCFRPPLFDNAATTGFVDDRTGAVFSSDCGGAPLPDAAAAMADDVGDLPAREVAAAQQLWATVDSPWVHGVDRERFSASLAAFGEPGLDLVLSTHLPPARNRGAALLETLAAVPALPPFVGPDQAALEQLLAGFAPEQRASQDAQQPV
jgi:hypothetical protein